MDNGANPIIESGAGKNALYYAVELDMQHLVERIIAQTVDRNFNVPGIKKAYKMAKKHRNKYARKRLQDLMDLAAAVQSGKISNRERILYVEKNLIEEDVYERFL